MTAVRKCGHEEMDFLFSPNLLFKQSGCVMYSRGVCGCATQGYAGLRRPPLIDPRDPSRGFYDCCFNNVRDMTIIFDNSQVYPEYIVNFDYNIDYDHGEDDDF